MKPYANKSLWRTLWRYARIGGFCASLLCVLGLVLTVVLYGVFRTQVPNVLAVKDYRPILKSKVFAQNGELIAEFGVHERIVMKPGTIPPLIAQAFVSSEDKNFFRHHGIDFAGVINAVVQSLSGQRSTLRGASTITQQLAKSLLVKEEGYEQATARTISRKMKEAILARRLEMHLSKDEILWIYLNEVYLGHGSYGVAAAARNYFRKNLNELSISEMAMIAGLPQAPSRFSPQVNRTAALARQSYVLGRMRDDGFITQEQHDQAMEDSKTLKIYARENSFRKAAPYFSETVRRRLVEEFGEQRIYEDGLHIYTTLDADHERAMQSVLKQALVDIDKRQGFSGPIYRSDNENSRTRAGALVAKINEQDLLSLGKSYAVAQVTLVDTERDAVFISLGSHEGVIPLAGMLWARTRDPLVNFEAGRLRQVGTTLQTGDVVLVKERGEHDLRRLNEGSSKPQQFFSLMHHVNTDLSTRNLKLYSLEQEPRIEGAMVSIEPQSGYVTAMSGGYSFDRSEFNRVYQACRQPGSAFKPVVYSAAIALKKYTPATMVIDAPLTFHDGSNESTWRPKNLGNGYKGEVTVREAIMQSMNMPAINTLSAIGMSNFLEWAKKLGIATKLKPELGVSIGSSCITPWELGRVFTTFANLGAAVEPMYIKEITDRDHTRMMFAAKKSDPWILRSDRLIQIATESFATTAPAIEKEDAYTMHYLLTEVARHGTAQRTNALNRPIAGKTGTTNDSYDTWFAGYAKSLMALAWIGNDMMDVPLGVYEQGGRTALPVFNAFMAKALQNLPAEDWTMPDSMCTARIDSKTGLRITTEHPLSFVAPFRCGSEPALLESAPHQSLEQAMDVLSGG